MNLVRLRHSKYQIDINTYTQTTSTDGLSTRPKRPAKLSEKCIQNRVQSDQAKLEKLWKSNISAVNKLHYTPGSTEQVKLHTSEVHSCFHLYHSASLRHFWSFWQMFMTLSSRNNMKHCKNYMPVAIMSMFKQQ